MKPGGWVLNFRPDPRCCEVRVSGGLWACQFAVHVLLSQVCLVLVAILQLDAALAVMFDVQCLEELLNAVMAFRDFPHDLKSHATRALFAAVASTPGSHCREALGLAMVTVWSFAGELLEVWSFPVRSFELYRGLGLELSFLDRFDHYVVRMFFEASESESDR
jgi:hypothetical protein